MIEVELRLPDSVASKAVIRAVEQVCASHDLTCTLKGTLIRYPESVHWHFKRGRGKGTLEITWWERESRLWFKVADGRTAAWIDENLPRLKEKLEKLLL